VGCEATSVSGVPVTKIVVIIVPGRNDRAFYSSLIRRMLERNTSVYIESLDAHNRRGEKDKIVQCLVKSKELSRKTSALLIHNKSKGLAIVIFDSQGNPTGYAATIIGYIEGAKRKPPLTAIIVAEDAEDKTPEERLKSLRDSLRAQLRLHRVQPIELTGPEAAGRYFEEYRLESLNGVSLILLVQGLTELKEMNTINVAKHAIEDFVIYSWRKELKNLLEKCRTLEEHLNTTHKHKKLAVLAAVVNCHNSIEELLQRELTPKQAEEMIRVHDGLKRLKEIIESTISKL
jgi:hypothetical protein